MAWESGFFNSVNHDRKYGADTFNKFFEGLITDGVFLTVGNKLAVQPSSGMTIQVATGKGWFFNHWVRNTTPYQLTLEASDVTLNRYAAICVRVDETLTARTADIYVKYSDIASSPKKPGMVRSETVHEYCLAYVYIKAGATSIGASNIIDTRADSTLCGYVGGLLQQMDLNTLYTQYEAQATEWFGQEKDDFYEWLENLQDVLRDNTEATLTAALPTSGTYVLAAENWNKNAKKENEYTFTLDMVNMTAAKMVFVTPHEDYTDIINAYQIAATRQNVGKLVFTAVGKPTEDVRFYISYMGE